MAKIPTTRLNSAPVVYEQNEFNQLIEDLQDIIKILNTTKFCCYLPYYLSYDGPLGS